MINKCLNVAPFRARTDLRRERGFTIVELLIVIVVIAVLAAISVVAFNGIQQRAAVSAKVGTVQQIVRLLQMHKADKGEYPMPPSAGFFCLTTDNQCTSFDGSAVNYGNDTLTNALREYGTPPSQSSDQVVSGGRYGISYTYFSNRTLDSQLNPVVVMFYLDGTNQTCAGLISGMVSVADSGIPNNLTPSVRSNGNSGGKTRCYMMFPN